MNLDKNNDEEILIVEDSPTQAELLKFLLEKNDYRVWVAYNGREALEMITKKGKPTLVISDIIMPEMDGYELCRCIKKDEKLKDIPVILLTSLSDSRDVLKGLECGADNFITKSYDEKYILSRVQYLLANRQIREREKMEMGIKMFFGGQEYYITAARQQILDLLISTYETALQKNIELQKVQDELRKLNEELEKKVESRTASLRAEMDVRKRAEEELRSVSLYTRNLIEASLDPLVTISPEGKITDVNKAIELVTGISRVQLIGSDFSVYFTEHEKAREVYQHVFEKGFVKDYPLAIKHVSGSITDVLYNATVYKDAAGNVVGIFAAVRDITERKKAEETLRESEERNRLLIDFSPYGIIIHSEGKIIFINSQAMNILGATSAQEIVGKPILDIVHPDYHDIVKERILMEEEGKIAPLIEQKFIRIDGSPVDVEIVAIPVNFRGKIYKYGVFHDITERKKADEIRIEKERLEYASKAKSEFLASMSHELRTPLNSILGFSQLLIDGMTGGELNDKHKHFIENIHNSGNFLLTLINDILDLSKIEAGKIELNIEKIPLQNTIEETLTLIKEKAMKHRINIKKEFEPGLDLIDADKQRLKQILFNLLSNAVKFSKEEGGTVTITTRKVDDNVQISVSDTGIGIKPENMEKLFQKFEQLEKGISQKYGGTGLGLAISKQLVEQHRGKIWAQSKYGEGSTFTFTLPIEIKQG